MQVEEWQAEILPAVVLRGAHAHSIMIRTDVWDQSPIHLANETVRYKSAPSDPSSELEQMEEVKDV